MKCVSLSMWYQGKTPSLVPEVFRRNCHSISKVFNSFHSFQKFLIYRGDTKEAFVLLNESQNIRIQRSLLSRSAEEGHDS